MMIIEVFFVLYLIKLSAGKGLFSYLQHNGIQLTYLSSLTLFKDNDIYLKLASPWFSFIPDKHSFSIVLFIVWLLCGRGLLEYL